MKTLLGTVHHHCVDEPYDSGYDFFRASEFMRQVWHHTKVKYMWRTHQTIRRLIILGCVKNRIIT